MRSRPVEVAEHELIALKGAADRACVTVYAQDCGYRLRAGLMHDEAPSQFAFTALVRDFPQTVYRGSAACGSCLLRRCPCGADLKRTLHAPCAGVLAFQHALLESRFQSCFVVSPLQEEPSILEPSLSGGISVIAVEKRRSDVVA